MHVPAGTSWVRSVVIVALVLGAAGCSGDDPPPAGTVTSSAPSATSNSPSPTATPVEQQVEAAVRAYYAELTHAAQTNDTSTLKAMLRPSCPCFNAVKILDKNARTGRTTGDAKFSLRSVKVHDVTGKTAAAEVRYDVSAYDVLRSNGTVVSHVRAQSSHLDLSLLEVGRRWRVANTFDLEGR
jgi:hypothetical protein